MNETPGNPVMVVAGGGRGIGAATAQLAAQRGYTVAINYATDHASAAELVSKIRHLGGNAFAIQGDVSLAENCTEIIKEAAQSGRIVAVVNNAAVTANEPGPFAQVSEAALRKTVGTNILGTMFMSQAAIRYWTSTTPKVGEDRCLVNVSSTATKAGSPGEWVHYASTKGAVDIFTRGLAAELGPTGIRVNAVAPGLVDTGLHAEAGLPRRVQDLAPLIPLQRAGQPDEIATAVLWLCSEEAAYVSGTVLNVSGGR